MEIMHEKIIVEAQALAESAGGMISKEVIRSLFPNTPPKAQTAAFTAVKAALLREHIRIISHQQLLLQCQDPAGLNSWGAQEKQRTQREFSRGLRAILNGNPPLASEEERRELIRRAKQGDKKSRDRLLLSCSRWVAKLVFLAMRRRAIRHMGFEDLFMEGWVGLEKALDLFDLDRGFKFSTYATWWIRSNIYRALYNKEKAVRIPVHTVEAMTRYKRTAADLRWRFGREPTREEVRDQLEMSAVVAGRIEETMAFSEVSMEAPINSDGERTICDLLAAVADDQEPKFEAMPEFLLSSAFLQRLHDVEPRGREIVILHLMGWTLEEIGRRFSIVREMARQAQVHSTVKMHGAGIIKAALSDTDIEYLRSAVRAAMEAKPNERVFTWDAFGNWLEKLEGRPARSDLLEIDRQKFMSPRDRILGRAYWFEKLSEPQFARMALSGYRRGKPEWVFRNVYRSLMEIAWRAKRLRRGCTLTETGPPLKMRCRAAIVAEDFWADRVKPDAHRVLKAS